MRTRSCRRGASTATHPHPNPDPDPNQSSLIVVASVRLALAGSKPLEWVATKRDAEYVPPELAQAGGGGAAAAADQGGVKG